MGKRGTFSILLGLLLIAAALFLTYRNFEDSNRAGEAAQEVVIALHEDMPQTFHPSSDRAVISEIPYQPYVIPDMPVQLEGEYGYIGILYIPSLELTLPIMDQWDYNRLEVAPCVYAGSYFTDNLVICGHNYLSQLGSLWWISLGAEVYLTTVDGYAYRYVVDNVETVQPSEIDRMISSDGWDLTLFTCYSGGGTRCTVRCVFMPE